MLVVPVVWLPERPERNRKKHDEEVESFSLVCKSNDAVYCMGGGRGEGGGGGGTWY